MFQNDHDEARALLRGYQGTDGRGLPKLNYLEAGSVQERDALAAMARVLRMGSLAPDLCYALADLFDPDPDPFKRIIPEASDRAKGYVTTTVVNRDRKLVFKFRRQGPRRDASTCTAIMQHMFSHFSKDKRRRGARERALQSAADTYNISRELAEDIWTGYQWAVDRDLLREDD